MLNPKRFVLLAVVCLCAVPVLFGQQAEGVGDREQAVKLSIEIDAPIDKVWNQWATTDGISRFFAPSSRMELRPLGRFDVYFRPDAPDGKKGAEGNLILGVQEKQMLSFTWDAPPQWPEIRKQRTHVTLRFNKLAENKTRVNLTHVGWGSGKEWDEVRKYFDSAWGDTVLPLLKYSLEVGPVDWSDFPNKLPKSLKAASRQ